MVAIDSDEASSHIDRQVFAASFAQEYYWILDQLEPDSAINTIASTVEVNRALVPGVLQACLNFLIERHDILRTTFRMKEGHLVQVITPHLHLPLLVLDLRERPQAVQQVPRLAREQARQPFVPDQGPLMRCTLLLLGSERSVLLLSLHRMICDGWSVGLLVNELAQLYEISAVDQPTPLPPLAWQYTDFVAWQRQQQHEPKQAEHLAYWRKQVIDAPVALSLPTDYPRPAMTSVHSASYAVTVSIWLTQALHALSQQQDVSLDVLLTASWLSLLWRYTGQQDLLIGMIMPAQRSAQAQALVGPCENPLVLRADLSAPLNFLDLLQQVREKMQALMEHADVSLEAVVKAVSPSRSWSQQPLFSVLLRLPSPQPCLPANWNLSHVDGEGSVLPVDLMLGFQEGLHGLVVRFVYRPDLFEEASIARMAQHWQTLAEDVVVAPTRPLARLTLLTAQERHLLLEEWTATHKEYPHTQSVHHLFEAQVRRSPQALAVLCDGEQMCYQDLNQQANRLAHHLQAQGVGPETLVALLAERGIPFLIAVLAIFKAGGAYLPLDPHHPSKRLRRVLEQSACPLVLTTRALTATLSDALEGLPAIVRPRILHLEDIPQVRGWEENLPATSSPEHLAYVIYTSGSTGLPKGAMVEQRGMLNHLYAKIEALHLTAADVVAQTASQCFDISVWQFLAVLLVGGRVHIYLDAVAHDARQLLQQVEQDQVSILETVPSLLRAMLDAQDHQRSQGPSLERLRWLIPTGEELPVELCRRWLARYPHVPLLNAYGPTECSDDVTHYVIAQAPREGIRRIPIGTAIANMRLYVLDRHLQPVPIGVSGELYIGGIGVGRGYLGEKQRSAQVFLPDPFAPQEGMRLYKTGDLARYLPDGNLEFLGRVDQQIKVRGYRIELGEIEAVLSTHPAVREAVVVARQEAQGEQRLVAYVVPHQGQHVSIEELKNQVKQQVPPYMVPATFLLMDALPITTNGKLDRAALPAPPERERTEERESYIAPVLPLHRLLVAIWEEVLGVCPIGIRDDFFELGGDSLRAVQLFERIEQVSGKKLALATLFAGATIEQVAKALEGESKSESRTPLVVVQAGGSRRPFFFLHGQWTGGALYSLELARHLGPDQPFYHLEPYTFDGLAIPPTIEEMAAAHLEAMRRVQPEGPYLLGGWCNGGLVAYEMARQLHAQGQVVDLLVLMDSDAPAPKFVLDRRIIVSLCKALRVGVEKQVDWFLLYRHVRLSFYHWRVQRFRRRDTTKRAEHEMDGVNEVPPSHTALLPGSEILRQDWLGIYDWAAAGYMPHSYPGKITFFWTEEEPSRRKGWEQLIQGKDVDICIIPGNHITSRTKYLPALANQLSACLRKVSVERTPGGILL